MKALRWNREKMGDGFTGMRYTHLQCQGAISQDGSETIHLHLKWAFLLMTHGERDQSFGSTAHFMHYKGPSAARVTHMHWTWRERSETRNDF